MRIITLFASSIALALGLAAASSAALLNLSPKSFLATRGGDGTYEDAFSLSGSFTLEASDGFARPVGYRITEDGSVNYGQVELSFARWSSFSGYNTVTFAEGGTYDLRQSSGDESRVLLYFSPRKQYTQNTTEKFRLFTGVQYNYGPDYRPDPIRDRYVDVEIHFAPVPEPASLAVLGFGALATLRKRKNA